MVKSAKSSIHSLMGYLMRSDKAMAGGLAKDSVQTMWLYKCTSEQHVPMIQTQQVWELYKHAQQAYIFLRTLGDTGGAHMHLTSRRNSGPSFPL